MVLYKNRAKDNIVNQKFVKEENLVEYGEGFQKVIYDQG